jgi:hypothetical protein
MKIMTNQESNQQPPRLTMKILSARMDQIQEENLLLTQRVNELEQLQKSYGSIPSSTAAASEISADLNQPFNATDNWALPRSVRHPAPEKKSFWHKLFG